MKWPVVNLSEAAEINPRFQSSLPDNTEVTFVPMSAVSETTASITEPEVRLLGQVKRGFTPFRDNDVLFAKITPCMENGKVAVATALRNGIGFGSTEFHVLRAKTGVLPSYIYYFLRQETVRRWAKQLMRGAAGQQRVPEDFFDSYRIPLPPLSEQRRIVEILEQADALRRKRAAADAQAARILPALFYQMFGAPATNPKGWPVKPLGELATIDYGLAEQLSLSETADTGIPIVRIGNVLLNGELDLSDMRYSPPDDKLIEKLKLLPGDLLFNWRNGSPQHVGKTAIWEFEQPHIFVSFLLRIRCNEVELRSYYLWALLNLLRASGFFSRTSRMQINRKFNATELSQLKIPRPPVELQRKFEARLLTFRRVVMTQRTGAKAVEDLFQSLLHRAFSGELTARWREAHLTELLAEMEQQAKALEAIKE